MGEFLDLIDNAPTEGNGKTTSVEVNTDKGSQPKSVQTREPQRAEASNRVVPAWR
ncbi:BQ5605_C024g09942 [Microbotryum silenes-dioicae]|uniref:BQ5605_C024g09942 protein n=1 Tax=Microbotryum silenes-dioicae TaxID=796604 RepID=A0A2X0MQ88_9BASI|nr:BQ5605_C024g09942 [Microbotryum silenes-dioicae]